MTEMPDTREMSDTQLVDALGEVRETTKKFKKMEDYYKKAIGARLSGEGTLEGKTYFAVASQRSRSGLDTEKVKETMGPEWYEGMCKTTSFTQIETKRRNGV